MLDEDLCGWREADFPPADAWSADTSCCLFMDLSAFRCLHSCSVVVKIRLDLWLKNLHQSLSAHHCFCQFLERFSGFEPKLYIQVTLQLVCSRHKHTCHSHAGHMTALRHKTCSGCHT